MAKQNAFDQVLRDRPAVYSNEGLAGPLRFALNGARDHFLANTGFTFNKNFDLRCGSTFAQSNHALHGFTMADQICKIQAPVSLTCNAFDFALQRFDLQSAVDGNFQAFGGSWFYDKINGTGAHGIDRGVDGAMGGLHDNWGNANFGFDRLKNGHTIHSRHHKIKQHQRNRGAVRPIQDLNSSFAANDTGCFKAKSFDGFFKDAALGGIVIND